VAPQRRCEGAAELRVGMSHACEPAGPAWGLMDWAVGLHAVITPAFPFLNRELPNSW
jgi:hypothetical protein